MTNLIVDFRQFDVLDFYSPLLAVLVHEAGKDVIVEAFHALALKQLASINGRISRISPSITIFLCPRCLCFFTEFFRLFLGRQSINRRDYLFRTFLAKDIHEFFWRICPRRP